VSYGTTTTTFVLEGYNHTIEVRLDGYVSRFIEFREGSPLAYHFILEPVATPEPVSSDTEAFVSDASALAAALGEDGPWLTYLSADINAGDVYVNGTTVNENLGLLERKLNLISNGRSRTLTVTSLIINSPHLTIEGGVINGNIVVNSQGFVLDRTEVNGNVTFASEEIMNSAVIGNAVINGGIAIGG
jgi:hypothetical protein